MSSDLFQCDARLRQEILDRAMALGACAAGFAAVEPVDEAHRRLYSQWLGKSMQGDMAYLERYCDVRDNPALLLDGARTIMSIAFCYKTADTPSHPLFADYAMGSDYHEVLRRRLEPLCAFMQEIAPGSATRICIDTAPIRERYWAAKAGVGFIGKNNYLIVPGIGSAVFLAEILWTASVEPSPSRLRQTCGGCNRCVRACPQGALAYDGTLDCRKCLSYLTIEHRGNLPEDLSLAGKRIYGCDICRHACPYGEPSPRATVISELQPRPSIMALDIDAVAAMDQPTFSATFTHSAIKRAKLAGLLRNAKHR